MSGITKTGVPQDVIGWLFPVAAE